MFSSSWYWSIGRWVFLFGWATAIVGVAVARANEPIPTSSATPGQAGTSPVLMFGGCGGAYLMAAAGNLQIDVYKRDRNRRTASTELRAILTGPDRQVVQEVSIPDDGLPRGTAGRLQTARLSARVAVPGIYVLNVTVSNDRYGQNMVWGFATNCAKYVIETARGHKDERHQEPIVLDHPGHAADICFQPRRQEIVYEVTGLPKEVRDVRIFDAQDAVVSSAPVSKAGKASGRIASDVPRAHLPWRLHLDDARATVNMDGLTRWQRGDPSPDICCWTPDPSSWFPWLENRWLLTPYHRTVFAEHGDVKSLVFRVHNNADRARSMRLKPEFSGTPWAVDVQPRKVTLAPHKSAEIVVALTVPSSGSNFSCHVRAEVADATGYSMYATIDVRVGTAPAVHPIPIPLLLKPYAHENTQFGYLPDYPTEWEPYFDLENRPSVRTASGVQVLCDNGWQPSVTSSGTLSSGRSNTKMAFDQENRVYTIASTGRAANLMVATDAGRTFSSVSLGRSGAFDIEQYSGHNVPADPPPILRSVRTAKDPKLRWRALNDLELVLPQWRNGKIVIGEPILLSRQSLGVGSHSGIPSAVVSRGNMVHVIWAEATDPKEKVPGVPTFVASVDRAKRKIQGEPVLIGYGAPPNDVHNRPCIVMDSRGYLHALTGTHGQPFQYAQSLQPNTAHAGWTKAEPVGAGLPQTYVGMVCGPDDTLHLVFRYWRRGVAPHPLATHATLAYQRKRPGQPWEPPRVLIVAPFSEYSIFYHRLTIDRLGRLFLSYDYWSTYWFYRNDHVGSRRALMMSPDSGDTWRLVGHADLRARPK